RPAAGCWAPHGVVAAAAKGAFMVDGAPGTGPVPGWYPDPVRRASLRYWSGTAWTAWVWDGTKVEQDARPIRRALDVGDVAALRFVDEVFLPEAQAVGAVSPVQHSQLRGLLRRLMDEAQRPGAGPYTTPAASGATAAPPAVPAGVGTAAPRETGPW